MTLLRNTQEPSGIPLSTKLGTWIENDGPGLERPRQAMKEAERFAKKGRISVESRSLSATYNCVGMVLASRRAVVSPDRALTSVRSPGAQNGDAPLPPRV